VFSGPHKAGVDKTSGIAVVSVLLANAHWNQGTLCVVPWTCSSASAHRAAAIGVSALNLLILDPAAMLMNSSCRFTVVEGVTGMELFSSYTCILCSSGSRTQNRPFQPTVPFFCKTPCCALVRSCLSLPAAMELRCCIAPWHEGVSVILVRGGDCETGPLQSVLCP
jgi:hypothetical protein